MEHVPRVSPYSPDSIDPGFVEIGLYSSRNQYKRRMLHTHAHTYQQANYIMAPGTHPGMKRLFRPKAKNGLIKTGSVASLARPCLIMKRLFALKAKSGLIKGTLACSAKTPGFV